MKTLFLLLIVLITSCTTINVADYKLTYEVDSTKSYMGTDFPTVETYLMKYNRFTRKYDVALRAVAGGFVPKEQMIEEYNEMLRER